MRGTKENTILKWMTFVTSVGDYLTFFAILMITQDLFKNIWLSSYNVAIQALAVAVGCFLVPKILSNYKIKHVFIFTQLVSMLTVFALYFLLHYKLVHTPIILYASLFIITVLWQIFSAARETYSKTQTQKEDLHRTMQAELLEGFYSAQVVGPILATLLILKFGSYFPLLIDGISFGLCTIVAIFLTGSIKFERPVSLSKPFSYLRNRPMLKKIFLLRTIGFWVPISIFNLVCFPMAIEQYKGIFATGSELLGSAFIYSLLGLGATIGTISVRKGLFKTSNISDGRLAFYCQLVMATTMLLLVLNISFALNQLFFLINGIAMGTNALSTQTIRRKLASNEEFVEIVSLEPVFGRLIDYVVASICILIPQGEWKYLIIVASLYLIFIAKKHLSFDTEIDRRVVFSI